MQTEEQIIKTEKRRARELRKSRWWQNRIQQNATCYYCNKRLTKDEVTMDHILPLSKGGKSTKGNIVISCKECNNLKKDASIFEIETFYK